MGVESRVMPKTRSQLPAVDRPAGEIPAAARVVRIDGHPVARHRLRRRPVFTSRPIDGRSCERVFGIDRDSTAIRQRDVLLRQRQFLAGRDRIIC